MLCNYHKHGLSKQTSEQEGTTKQMKKLWISNFTTIQHYVLGLGLIFPDKRCESRLQLQLSRPTFSSFYQSLYAHKHVDAAVRAVKQYTPVKLK